VTICPWCRNSIYAASAYWSGTITCKECGCKYPAVANLFRVPEKNIGMKDMHKNKYLSR
jgi:DNA-directed RNA polymerase subunit M/transcription elongation factor TFIIS